MHECRYVCSVYCLWFSTAFGEMIFFLIPFLPALTKQSRGMCDQAARWSEAWPVWHITPYEGQKATCYNSMAPCHRNWNGWVNTLIILEWTLNCPTLPPSLPSSLSSSLCPSIPPPYVPLCPFFHLQDLEVASVDAFQECEKYYIILSCVVCTWQHHHSIVVFLVITTSTAWNARFLECIRIHWM